MKLMRWPAAVLTTLALGLAARQAAAQGGIQVYNLERPIAGQPSQLVPAGAFTPPQPATGRALRRHSTRKPPAPEIQPNPRLDAKRPEPPSLLAGKSIASGQGFDAIAEVQAGAGNTPPDPNIAVSPVLDASSGARLIVETVNQGIRVFNQNGSPAGGFTPFVDPNVGFFSKSSSASTDIFDPRLVFDPYAKRFFAIALEWGDTKGHIHIAVSASDDPLGSWSVFKTDVPSTPPALFPDYPSLGLDRQAIYLGVNLFQKNQSLKTPPKALLYRAIDKASLLSATNPQITTMVDVVETTGSGQYHWAMRAAQLFDAPFTAPAEGLFMGTFRENGQQETAFQKLHVVKMRHPLDAARVSLAAFDVPVPAYREPSLDAPQLGSCATSAETIDVSSGQLLNAVWRQDDLYAAHTARLSGGPAINRARWYQIRTGPPNAPVTWSQLIQSGEITGSGSQHVYLPTISVDAQRSVVVAYAQSSSTEPVSFRIAARDICSPPGQMPYKILVKSMSFCYKEVVADTPPFRWGDYGAIAVDPSEPPLLWAVGEYVKSLNRWGTWVQPVAIVPECPQCACY